MDQIPQDWVGWLVAFLAGLSGIGTVLAGLLLAVWRHGYRSGKEDERSSRQANLIEQIAHNTE